MDSIFVNLSLTLNPNPNPNPNSYPQDESEEDEEELQAMAADREGLPEALTFQGGGQDAAETRGAAWAADGVAAAALAAVEEDESEDPPDEGPDTRALPATVGGVRSEAAGAVRRRGPPKVQPARAAAAGTDAAAGSVNLADSAGGC